MSVIQEKPIGRCCKDLSQCRCQEKVKCAICGSTDKRGQLSFSIHISGYYPKIYHCRKMSCEKEAEYYGLQERLKRGSFVPVGSEGGIYQMEKHLAGQAQSTTLQIQMGFREGATYSVEDFKGEIEQMKWSSFADVNFCGMTFMEVEESIKNRFDPMRTIEAPMMIIEGKVLLYKEDKIQDKILLVRRVHLTDILKWNPGAIKPDAFEILLRAIKQQVEDYESRNDLIIEKIEKAHLSAAACDSP
jgi:hypothetical protein